MLSFSFFPSFCSLLFPSFLKSAFYHTRKEEKRKGGTFPVSSPSYIRPCIEDAAPLPLGLDLFLCSQSQQTNQTSFAFFVDVELFLFQNG